MKWPQPIWERWSAAGEARPKAEVEMLKEGAKSADCPYSLLQFRLSLWAEFTKGKMTWGQFNTGRKSIIEDSRKRMLQASMQIGSELQGQHQAEMQQRQQAAEALSAWATQQQALAMQQQAINAANRPRIINCNYMGSTAQCTSN